MWYRVVTIHDLDIGRIDAVWIAPDGGQLLLLTPERTLYWSVREGRALWSVPEKAGGEGRSSDGRIYRDSASGLFYPVLGAHGGRQLRTHSLGGDIEMRDGRGVSITVTDSDGMTHPLSHEGCPDDWASDWRVVTFCEAGDHILITGPQCLVVYASSLSVIGCAR
uniref:PQQ-like domain-containing protein n=1 Tax=Candidatus Kentrum sp. TC TaxID=2126339 RepID=A0A450Z694_9GAMM|nr:MAG: hypothetical protein BECKTC1821D_GA0114238_107412 [Candidatus Kentron sp. TC]